MKMQRKKIRSGKKKHKTFEGEDGAGSAVLAEGARWSSGGIPAGGVRGGSHSAGRCGNFRRSRESSSRSESYQEL